MLKTTPPLTLKQAVVRPSALRPAVHRRAASRLALDASAGNRRFDENGFLHVSTSHISKETVNPYYGREIPGWEALGLDPERIYHGWRAGAELAAGAATFNGLPLLLDHYVDSAAAPQKEHRVGSLGTDAAFRAPYLDNSLVVTDAAAIAAIESGEARELSAAYMYDPVFTPGVFNGQPYDFVMTNIRGNHVALVQEGRAGPDVVVADARLGKALLGAGKKTVKQRFLNPQPQRTTLMSILNRLTKMARDNAPGEPAPNGPALYGPPAGSGEDLFAAPAVDCDDPADLSPDCPDPAALDDDLADFAARLDELLAEIPDQDMAAALRVMALAARGAQPQPPAAAGDDGEGDPDLAALLSGDDGELDPALLLSGDDDPAELLGATAQDHRLSGRLTRAKTGLSQRLRALGSAAHAVRPLIGEVDPLAFDSAQAIYRKALTLSGCNPDHYPASAWRGMCEMLKGARPGLMPPAMARDRAAKLDGPFKNLTTIRVEG